jgi:hypothetical protein
VEYSHCRFHLRFRAWQTSHVPRVRLHHSKEISSLVELQHTTIKPPHAPSFLRHHSTGLVDSNILAILPDPKPDPPQFTETFLALSPPQPLIIHASPWLQASRAQRPLRRCFQHSVRCRVIAPGHRKRKHTSSSKSSKNQYVTSFVHDSGRS